ncbi:hypothetical protein GCM10009078_07100 [Cupriavidus gilardii]
MQRQQGKQQRQQRQPEQPLQRSHEGGGAQHEVPVGYRKQSGPASRADPVERFYPRCERVIRGPANGIPCRPREAGDPAARATRPDPLAARRTALNYTGP